ncbi:MAG: hypothetical protein WAU45_11210 [Blastocatellia bacterium]
MTGSKEVVIRLTLEQREQLSRATGKNIGSVLLIEMSCSEPGPSPESLQSGELTTISST